MFATGLWLVRTTSLVGFRYRLLQISIKNGTRVSMRKVREGGSEKVCSGVKEF